MTEIKFYAGPKILFKSIVININKLQSSITRNTYLESIICVLKVSSSFKNIRIDLWKVSFSAFKHQKVTFSRIKLLFRE